VADFVAPGATVRLRFVASDLGAGSIVEAAVDDFRIFEASCEPPAPCTGDLDGDQTIGLADLSLILSNFGIPSDATPEQGDLDGDGDVDLTDLSSMLALFGSSCG
jgi:hypothetical protein